MCGLPLAPAHGHTHSAPLTCSSHAGQLDPCKLRWPPSLTSSPLPSLYPHPYLTTQGSSHSRMLTPSLASIRALSRALLSLPPLFFFLFLSRVWFFCHSMDCSPPGSSVRGIFQARILEWVAISSFRDLPDSGIEPASHSLTGRFFTTEPAGKPYSLPDFHSAFKVLL